MSFATDLRRYFQVLGALLRREEDSRRHAPIESIVSLLEPIFFIATMSFLFYFLGRRQISPLGGAPVMFYSTGFFPLYFFIYISRRMRHYPALILAYLAYSAAFALCFGLVLERVTRRSEGR